MMIETTRLKIYPISADELKARTEAQTDPILQAAYREMLDGCLKHPEQFNWYTAWTMELKTTGETVGDLCFKGLNADGKIEIGYGTYSGYAGRGYMTEAVTALCRWAMKQPGVSRVEAEAEEDNHASIRVLEKSGFRRTGSMGEEGPRFILKI